MDRDTERDVALPSTREWAEAGKEAVRVRQKEAQKAAAPTANKAVFLIWLPGMIILGRSGHLNAATMFALVLVAFSVWGVTYMRAKRKMLDSVPVIYVSPDARVSGKRR